MNCRAGQPPVKSPMSYPTKLSEIISLFESLPDAEKRDLLIVFADGAVRQAPREGETFDLEDVRKDEECTDTVGIFLKVNPDNSSHFRVTLGPQVQTLTKAMTSILCKGLRGPPRRRCSMSRLILCQRLSGQIWSGNEARPFITSLRA